MSKTPRTDAAQIFTVSAEFARLLEVEIKAQHEEIERLRNLKMIEAVDLGYVVLKPETYEALKRERDEAYESRHPRPKVRSTNQRKRQL